MREGVCAQSTHRASAAARPPRPSSRLLSPPRHCRPRAEQLREQSGAAPHTCSTLLSLLPQNQRQQQHTLGGGWRRPHTQRRPHPSSPPVDRVATAEPRVPRACRATVGFTTLPAVGSPPSPLVGGLRAASGEHRRRRRVQGPSPAPLLPGAQRRAPRLPAREPQLRGCVLSPLSTRGTTTRAPS